MGISVDILKTLSTYKITITLLNIIINITKRIWIFTLGESVTALKTISITNITIIWIIILLIEYVVVQRNIPTTHVTHI